MSKVKTFGPANDVDVPDVEITIAKLVQNAKAFGMGWTKFAAYRDKRGRPCDQDEAVRCCALGAKNLVIDTYGPVDTVGNDYGYDPIALSPESLADRSFDAGLGFRQAMK